MKCQNMAKPKVSERSEKLRNVLHEVSVRKRKKSKNMFFRQVEVLHRFLSEITLLQQQYVESHFVCLPRNY